MKKLKLFATILVVIATIATLSLTLTACDPDVNDPGNIVVGASSVPHAEILNACKDALKKQGYTLHVKIFDDYITPNTALEDGQLNANFFQHTPYLETFNAEHGTHLAAVAKIHYEPLCVFGNGVSKQDYETVKTGRKILIPNDGSNRTRALLLLRDEGYITLADGVSANDLLTVSDIVDDGDNIISDVEAKTVAIQLKNSEAGTIAVINGNYALQAGLDFVNSLASENKDSEAATLYANVVAVKQGNENDPKIAALVAALKSKEVYDFIISSYGGAVLPAFTA